MNPTTQLTEAQIKKICTHHSIAYHGHVRITEGFSHEVHRLNDDMVIKLHNRYDSDPDAAKRFKTECAVLGSRLAFPKPQLIASSDSRDIVDRDYIIMTYVQGIPLGSVWHEATEAQREQIIKDIARTLRTINQFDPALLGAKPGLDWYSEIAERSTRLVSQLKAGGLLAEDLLVKVEQTFERSLPFFEDSRIYPVYWDVHFDNFLVNEDFELQAVIDLETVESAALDYPLFVIQKMTDTPEKYLSEQNEQYAKQEDYASLKSYYETYYPEMFAVQHLKERVNVYELFDALHLIIHWPKSRENYARVAKLVT